MSAKALWQRLVTGGWPAIEALWTERTPESVHLDFKTVGAHGRRDRDLARGLARSLSGFANTEGGVLIYGVDAADGVATSPVLVADPVALVAVLSGRVLEATQPSIAGVECRTFFRDGLGGEGVVGVYVPESDGGPFRAVGVADEINDKYFMRTVDSIRVMPHALLSDRFGRTARPALSLQFQFSKDHNHPRLNVTLTNRGRGTARQPAIAFESLPHQVILPNNEFHQGWHPHYPFRGGVLVESSADLVIYPGSERGVLALLPGQLAKPASRWQARLSGSIYALDCAPVRFDVAANAADHTVPNMIETPER